MSRRNTAFRSACRAMILLCTSNLPAGTGASKKVSEKLMRDVRPDSAAFSLLLGSNQGAIRLGPGGIVDDSPPVHWREQPPTAENNPRRATQIPIHPPP